MSESHYVQPTSTYYGLAVASYMDTKRTRHISDEAYDAMDCGHLAGFEFEVDLDEEARNYIMTGNNAGYGAYADFNHNSRIKQELENKAHYETIEETDDIPF